MTTRSENSRSGEPSRAALLLARVRGGVYLLYLVVMTLIVGTFSAPLYGLGMRGGQIVVMTWSRCALFGLRIICGLRFEVIGRENLPTGAAIVAANHQSMWETFALFTLLPQPVTAFKQELMRVPIYGWWSKRAGSIPIDREGGARSMRQLISEARARLEAGMQFVIFPEGTRIPLGERAPLQPGVAGIYAAANAPVVPVTHDSGRFWRHPGVARLPGVITVRVLPAIPAGLDRRVFMARLEAALAEARPDLQGAAPGGLA